MHEDRRSHGMTRGRLESQVDEAGRRTWESKVGLLMRALTNTRRWLFTMYGLTCAFLFFLVMTSTTYLPSRTEDRQQLDILTLQIVVHIQCAAHLQTESEWHPPGKYLENAAGVGMLPELRKAHLVIWSVT